MQKAIFTLVVFALIGHYAVYAQGTPTQSTNVLQTGVAVPTAVPTIDPVIDPDVPVDPVDHKGEPYFGCGGRGQACCPAPKYSVLWGKCFNPDDQVSLFDDEGNPVPGDYPSYGLGPWTCQCIPDPSLYDQISGSLSNLGSVISGAKSDTLCNRYFAEANYARFNVHGFIKNSTALRPLTPEVKAHLKSELNACLKCVGSDGYYTSLGCIPFEINTLLKGLVIIGLFIAGLLALFCIIYSAIRIQLSRGDATKVSKAQESVKSCIMGLILIIFSAFIVNLFGTGLLGFSITQPHQKAPPIDDNLQCNRECVYSERHGTSVSCYRGACPDNEPECGKPGTINYGCAFAPKCGNFENVACPAIPSLTPQPSPAPTPPPTGTITPPPGTITPGPVTPGPGTPIPGGPSLVTEQMIADAVLFHRELAKSCGNELHVFDMSCVDKVNIPIANLDVIKAQIKGEMTSLYKLRKISDLQCLGYIKAFMSLYTGHGGGSWPSTNGTAASLLEPLIITYSGLQYELAFINKNVAPPLPGDFAKFRDYKANGSAGDGHIAFVNGTINGAQFTVLQANLGAKYTTCNGCISAMVVERSNPLLTGYYRWQKKP